MTSAQPTGTVTLVFTDIEGSTRLLEQLGVESYRDALAEHRRIVREACARYDGYEVDYEGDAFFYAFASAESAVNAVAAAIAGLDGGPIRIRVGVHTGEPALDPPKYVGLDVHRAARIMSAAHGGQVVLSPSTVALLEPGSIELSDLGTHRLKDLTAPIPLHQLVIAGLGSEFPPLRTLYRSNLPVPATPFLGREEELAVVGRRLADPATRLLTLTGPGGTGKTRLALQSAAEVADNVPDGITWVPLAPTRDPDFVLPAIAQALGVRERTDESLADTLARTLTGQRALLLLDNLEHLLPAAADHVAALVDGCPTLTVLVTSRERLQLASETVWPVPPMSPTDGERLFLDRALAAGVELAADETVRELCRRLDELPLAIQLAAARTRSLSPAAILDRLDQRLTLLTAGARDVEERQRTLEATIAWSYDLLEPEEQRALRALSVFAGGCTLEAAEQVAGVSLDTIESLLDKSLIGRRIDQAGQDRYWMLETPRQYAQRELEARGERVTAGAAHTEYFAERLAALWPRVRNYDDAATAMLEADIDNGREALAAALRDEDATGAAQLLWGLFFYLGIRGLHREARAAADGYLRLDCSGVEPHVRLMGDLAASEVLRFTGDPSRARELKLSWLELAGQFPDLQVHPTDEPLGGPTAGYMAIAVLTDLADVELTLGNVEEARQAGERALEQRRALGDSHGIAHALTSVATVATVTGDLERAAACWTEIAETYEATGFPEASMARVDLAEVVAQQGDVQGAVVLLAEHLPREEAGADVQGLIRGLLVAIQVLSTCGRRDVATILGRSVVALIESTGLGIRPWDAARLEAALSIPDTAQPARSDGAGASLDVLSTDHALALARETLLALED